MWKQLHLKNNITGERSVNTTFFKGTLCNNTLKLDIEKPTTKPEIQGLLVFLEKSVYSHLSSSSVKALIMKCKSSCWLDPVHTFILKKLVYLISLSISDIFSLTVPLQRKTCIATSLLEKSNLKQTYLYSYLFLLYLHSYNSMKMTMSKIQ